VATHPLHWDGRINAAKSSAFTVPGKVEGVATRLLLDSGAAISVIDPEGIPGIKPAEVRRLASTCRETTTNVRTVTGEVRPVRGIVKIHLKIAEHSFSGDMLWLQGSQPPILLGMDLLQEQGAVFDLGKREVFFPVRRRNGEEENAARYGIIGLNPVLSPETAAVELRGDLRVAAVLAGHQSVAAPSLPAVQDDKPAAIPASVVAQPVRSAEERRKELSRINYKRRIRRRNARVIAPIPGIQGDVGGGMEMKEVEERSREGGTTMMMNGVEKVGTLLTEESLEPVDSLSRRASGDERELERNERETKGESQVAVAQLRAVLLVEKKDEQAPRSRGRRVHFANDAEVVSFDPVLGGGEED
jgi:hypothetical protein